MSNLIKAVYFNVDPSKVRKIDSDEMVEEFIPNIYDQPEEPDSSGFQPFDMSLIEHIDGEVSEGLPAVSAEEVPEEDYAAFSERMQEEREEILAQAREEAEQMVTQARAQAEEIKEDARMKGFVQGTEEARAQVQTEYDQLRAELQEDYEKRFSDLEEEKKNLEPVFADLVVSLVRKLTGIVCEDKKEVILYLIGNAIRNAGKTSSIVLRVSRRDIALVSAKKNTLKMIAKDVTSFDVFEDESLTENQCIIETDNKIIDCSLDSELQNLEEQIKLLAY
ncbi:MAG: hypothetical protein IJ733_18445 [Lachnospiraceae bacterium]|nr:hypothetical protein [Lachnospiraceae bacterium]